MSDEPKAFDSDLYYSKYDKIKISADIQIQKIHEEANEAADLYIILDKAENTIDEDEREAKRRKFFKTHIKVAEVVDAKQVLLEMVKFANEHFAYLLGDGEIYALAIGAYYTVHEFLKRYQNCTIDGKPFFPQWLQHRERRDYERTTNDKAAVSKKLLYVKEPKLDPIWSLFESIVKNPSFKWLATKIDLKSRLSFKVMAFTDFHRVAANELLGKGISWEHSSSTLQEILMQNCDYYAPQVCGKKGKRRTKANVSTVIGDNKENQRCIWVHADQLQIQDMLSRNNLVPVYASADQNGILSSPIDKLANDSQSGYSTQFLASATKQSSKDQTATSPKYKRP